MHYVMYSPPKYNKIHINVLHSELACSFTCFLKIVHQHWEENSIIQRDSKEQSDGDSGTKANEPRPRAIYVFSANIVP